MLVIEVNPGKDIQTAINKLSEANGGQVIINPGEHITGPIELTSNLTLTLQEGSIIKFKDDPMLYPPVWTRWEGVECFAMHPLVYSNNDKNVKINGTGTIDGSGSNWWKTFKKIEDEDRTLPREDYELRLANLNPDYQTRTGGGGRPSTQFLRPPLIQFWKGQNIVIEGITLKNSPFWTLHMVFSRDIQIENMTFSNPADAINTDAMDIDSSENVSVSNCLLDVGDDGVTLKSGSGADGIRVNRPTKNVHITGCRILASHGGIAIGSETAAGISNVEVSNCTFEGTRRGIRLKSRRTRGGTIQDIKLHDLTMDSCWCPISLEQYFAPGVLPAEEDTVLSKEPQPVDNTTPHIKNIQIKNITATNVRATAAFIVGLPEAHIQNVNIENFNWSLATPDHLLPTNYAEETGGRFHDASRDIKTINVSNLVINGKKLD
ncbi:glycoside hydrolase family 28 protein [Lentilactobacillus sp. TOM.63]|uniref:glycoside hydrolase family 28 protein n=1 Tax=Lentilactobacillus sp. TOM.63 TaxID=3055077 RepID=UPI0025A2A0F6|nr:glycoside hydrolase family 28 protein [Lentilactobacillus sp. TOM.63]MDM7517588.1 glycoside hydrolase family 28 protein [Lentilactobacillus sp. TOM.63]